MSHVTSVGLDVHARSVAACAFNPYTGEVRQKTFGTDAQEIASWIKAFEDPRAVYESGPTGFALCRELRGLGVDCIVGAVSKMQKPAADKRRKNDRRDAAFLARLLATHNIIEVWIPPVEVEAARDLSRALDDARIDLQRARQRLSKFLLRRGYAFDEVDALGRKRGAWTRAFWRWVEGLRPQEAAAAHAFDHYVTCVRCAESDKRALEKLVLAEARSGRWKDRVGALASIKGIYVISAFSLAAEAGLFSRFPTAGAYASWVGITPSEHSSGEREARGGITKTGNGASRRVLVESSWHYMSCSPKPKAAPSGYEVPRHVKSRADDATARLAHRHESLRAAGKRTCVANVAVARELACWVWEIGRRAEGTLG
ncbi:IS110 family transposase [Enorma phocaeensis]|uniref:IS110 family transposase n=1 Tax=Enorma phocaeensis TaxID=1871019 RepID=UPI000C83D522|nr:IS110 family transposase [Enorma phocaeensis]